MSAKAELTVEPVCLFTNLNLSCTKDGFATIEEASEHDDVGISQKPTLIAWT